MMYDHKVDCALNHYYDDSEGSWGAFGCDGAWPPGINLLFYLDRLSRSLSLTFLSRKFLYMSFSAYMDWIVNYNNGKIQVDS